MSELLILLAVALAQIVAAALGFAVVAVSRRTITAWRLHRTPGLAYPWRRAWRKAGTS